MAFYVTRILGTNEVMITPEWRVWKHNKGGNRVTISGYTVGKDSVERREAKRILMKHLLNIKIELKNVSGISGSGNLLAEVWVRGVNVADYMKGISSPAPRKRSPSPEEKREQIDTETASATHE